MTTTGKRRLYGFAIAAAIFVVDQVLKWIVDNVLDMQLGESIPLIPIFALTRTHNYGVSLGMFTAQSTEMKLALIAVTGLIAVVVLVWLLRERLLADVAGLALILGGALGNIQDRYQLGYVIDYADFHIGTFRPFLIFNVADAAITIGVLIILARALFMREKPPAAQDEVVADQTAENSTNA